MENNIVITEEMLDDLRERVKSYLTDKRYIHVLGVEREAASLGALYMPDSINALRAAALLHDITKRLDVEKQLKLLDEFGIMRDGHEEKSPKLLHARTAAALISRDFADFAADSRIVSAVRWHTTGRAGMSLFDMIIYLADYIEDTRIFEECVALRRYFYDLLNSASDDPGRRDALYKTLIRSFDITIRLLIEEGALIDRYTFEVRNWLIESGGI